MKLQFILNRYSEFHAVGDLQASAWVGFPFVSVYNCWFCSKFYYFYFVASILPLYFKIYPGLHYRARHLLIWDQKTPPPILYIKASTVDDEYCLTQLFHQVISSADKKWSRIYYSRWTLATIQRCFWKLAMCRLVFRVRHLRLTSETL